MRGAAVVLVLAVWVLLALVLRRRWRLVSLPWLLTVDLAQPVHDVTLTSDAVLRVIRRAGDLTNTLAVVHVHQDARGGHELHLPAYEVAGGLPAYIRADPHAISTLWLAAGEDNSLRIAST